MSGAEVSAPTPPAAVVAAVGALRAAFDDIHVMHECDQNCPEDCDLSDYSESAYRYHDEHNFDVRETVHDRAAALVDALDEWLEVVTAADQHVAGESSRPGALVAPLVVSRDPTRYQQWWDREANRTEIADTLARLTDESEVEYTLHELLLQVFQSDPSGASWLQVQGLAASAHVRWLSLDIDPAYDGQGVLDGVDVVLNLHVEIANIGQRWLAVSVYVSHPHRVLAPQASEAGQALGEVVDQALALINREIAERDDFAATARQLPASNVVASNQVVWRDPEAGEGCPECGAVTDELVSPQHAPACSLHPDNDVVTEGGGRR